MAKKLTASQVAKELNNIVFTFSGKNIGDWVQQAWEKSQKTTIGQAAGGVERAARAVDPYAVLGLPHSASAEEVEIRYRRLAKLFHPDVGGNEAAMKLVNNAYQQILREKGKGKA
ncbi:Chaperone protein DnaJ [subsurface metagenome]